MEKQGINRRTVLQRGMAFLAGMVGLEVVTRTGEVHAEIPAVQSTGQAPGGCTLRLFASHWERHGPGEPGKLSAPHGRTDRRGELYDATTGKRAGEFFTACLAPQSSFGSPCAAGIELHSFRIGAETLFGIGSPVLGAGGPQLHAILGGTGRFAGVKGSYAIGPAMGKAREGSVEIVVTILS